MTNFFEKAISNEPTSECIRLIIAAVIYIPTVLKLFVL